MTVMEVPVGAGWLPNLPDGWRLRPLWSMFERIKDIDHPEEEMLSVFRDYGVVPKDSRANLNRTAENRGIYQLVHPGWLVTNRMKAWQGAVGISPLRGIVSGHYICFAPRHAEDYGYLNWLFRSTPYVDAYKAMSRGVRPGQIEIDNDEYRQMPIILPPLDEQRAIADYLDRETARIDKLIEEQQRLIEMLRERRRSLIAQMLLKGVNSGVALRPTGDPRIGDIPQTWDLVRARYLCEITTGSEDSGNADDSGEYPFFVRGREILQAQSYSFDCEAVMTPGDGQGGTGKVFHYFRGKFEAHQRVYVFKEFTGISGRYFYYFLSAFLQPFALAASNTVTMESLRRPVLADFPIALPSEAEQCCILAVLDEQTSKLDGLVQVCEQFVNLARERRSALIAAAVTGQIDVRSLDRMGGAG